MKHGINKKAEVILYYLKGLSLRKISENTGVHYVTIHRWLKGLKKEGLKLFKNHFLPDEEEREILDIKQRNPNINLREAKEILETRGIHCSEARIWHIWKKFGFAGFKDSLYRNEFFWESKQSAVLKEILQKLLDQKRYREISIIVDSFPIFKSMDILRKVPDGYLSLKGKRDKYFVLMGFEKISKCVKVLKRLREKMEKRGLRYEASRTGCFEILGLLWMHRVKDIIDITERISTYANKKDPWIQFSLNKAFAIVYSRLLDFKKANWHLNKCKYYYNKTRFPYFGSEIAAIYSYFERYKHAKKWLLRKEKKDDFDIANLAIYDALEGNYKECMKKLNSLTKIERWMESQIYILKSYYFFGTGNLYKAKEYALKALECSRKEEIILHIEASSLLLASIYRMMNNTMMMRYYLKRYIYLLKKYKVWKKKFIREFLLYKNKVKIEEFKFFPVFHLLLLMEDSPSRAFRFARYHGMLGIFHRFIPFFPGIIEWIKRKKDLSKYFHNLLDYPLFNKEKQVFYVGFLGPLRVFRNSKRLRLKLSPKMSAFLIHLSLKLREPGSEIPVDEVIKNFWPNSKKPLKNLYKFMSVLRKDLRISRFYLSISRKKGCLVNKGIYFNTDYSEFEEHVVQARALLRAEEYEFAKKEFKSAFKLVRGEPFKKMYDRWSEDKRTEILFEIGHLKKNLEKSGFRNYNLNYENYQRENIQR